MHHNDPNHPTKSGGPGVRSNKVGFFLVNRVSLIFKTWVWKFLIFLEKDKSWKKLRENLKKVKNRAEGAKFFGGFKGKNAKK